MRVFADTSGLYASLVANDANHEMAQQAMRRLLRDECRISCSNLVLVETMALLQARVGLEQALEFHRRFVPILDIVWVDQRLHEAAARRLRLRASRKVSFVDASSFVIMEELSIETAFALDDHFRQEGFTILGQ